MTSRARQYKPNLDKIPQKPPLDLDFPDEEEGNETPVRARIGNPKLARLGNGTNYTPELAEASDAPPTSAPIHYPDRDKLAVNLVPADLVYQLEDCRSDESLVSNFFWVVIGTLLGIGVNWITSESQVFTLASRVVSVVLVVVALAVGAYWWERSRRAKAKQIALKQYMERYSQPA